MARRLLEKIYDNLSDNVKLRNKSAITVPTVREIQKANPELISQPDDIDQRLTRIEGLLEKILTQKRVKIIERDSDDLITKVRDIPDEGTT